MSVNIKEWCEDCGDWVEPVLHEGYVGQCPDCGSYTKDKRNSVQTGPDFADASAYEPKSKRYVYTRWPDGSTSKRIEVKRDN
jgi:hypothetical protein